MKFNKLFCGLFFLLCSVLCIGTEVSNFPCFPDSSLGNREQLKHIPRLGMTFGQLKFLWGGPTSESGSQATWENVGGIMLNADFAPVFSGRDGVVIDPNKSRCLSISFSYVDDKIPLDSEEVRKITQALLPGVDFNSLKDHVAKNGEQIEKKIDDRKIYELSESEKWGVFVIEFIKRPKVIEIDINKL